jgi:hypothetical protein
LTGKVNGYLDHLRENLETLDEQIVNARKMSKKRGKDSNALQWAKTLRDLVELRETTLANIKVHMLGRDETGAATEPADYYSGNSEVMFERDFKAVLKPWTQQDLKLECEDCGKESEEVSTRQFPREYQADECFDLCDRCYEKRTAKDTDESEERSEASDPVPILKEFAETQGEGNVNSTMSEAVTGLVGNTIRAVTLEARSPLEMVKMLQEFKAHLVKTAHSHASRDNIEPGVALLDREIERLQKEADLGKGQDATGKPAT